MMMNNTVCADLALFFPIQPIYVANPIFNDGVVDPVKDRCVLLAGEFGAVVIPVEFDEPNRGDGNDGKRYSIDHAKRNFAVALKIVSGANQGSRHPILRNQATRLGKLIAQNRLDEQEVIECLVECTYDWDDVGDTKKNMETILYGVDKGKKAFLDASRNGGDGDVF
jgi:hypothetical protein